MHCEGNIFYCVMPSCIIFYLAGPDFSSAQKQEGADQEFCGFRW